MNLYQCAYCGLAYEPLSDYGEPVMIYTSCPECGPDATMLRVERPVRAACCGASGTGKSEIAKWLAEMLKLPLCPIGSRSVSAEMGFASPYDVDAAGRRAEFQERLITSKAAWESRRHAFVTDRTLADNLAYLVLHKPEAVTDELVEAVRVGMRRYTHVVFFPMAAFWDTAGDPARVKERGYHWAYEAVLRGLLPSLGIEYHSLHQLRDLDERKRFFELILGVSAPASCEAEALQQLKRYTTSTKDAYRPPYEQRAVDHAQGDEMTLVRGPSTADLLREVAEALRERFPGPCGALDRQAAAADAAGLVLPGPAAYALIRKHLSDLSLQRLPEDLRQRVEAARG